MPELSRKELVLGQIAHRETWPIPYNLGIDQEVGVRLDEHYAGTAWRDRVVNSIGRWDPAGMVVQRRGDDPLSTDHYGTLWQLDRRPFHLVEPALKEPSLAGYSFPCLDALFGESWRDEAMGCIDAQRAAGQFVAVGFGFGLYERTWTLRGFNEAMMDAAAEPEFYDALCQAVAEHQMAIIERLLELPIDGIMFSDDWGYQRGVLLGDGRWRRFIKPRLARMYDQVHAAGKVTLSHCCGSVATIMPDIIEIGLDALESVQPEADGMDPFALKREYGADITFWGGLGSQSVIPFGTPADIRDNVKRLCDELAVGGGYILGPAKSLQPETPTENAVAVIEAFNDFSGFR
jgi:uroporphyrinogen decarboxylase